MLICLWCDIFYFNVLTFQRFTYFCYIFNRKLTELHPHFLLSLSKADNFPFLAKFLSVIGLCLSFSSDNHSTGSITVQTLFPFCQFMINFMILTSTRNEYVSSNLHNIMKMVSTEGKIN